MFRYSIRTIFIPISLLGAFFTARYFCISDCTGNALLSRILSNDIVFYGQVLDLEGNPVPNAKITYASLSAADYGSVWTGGGPPDKIMYADDNGRFKIHDVGGSLYVSCTHPDYYGNSDPQKGSKRKFGYGFQVGDEPARDPQNPAIFRLRKKGVCEPLYYSCDETIGKGQPWIRIPDEGLVIDLASGKAKITDRSIYISHKIREHKKTIGTLLGNIRYIFPVAVS